MLLIDGEGEIRASLPGVLASIRARQFRRPIHVTMRPSKQSPRWPEGWGAESAGPAASTHRCAGDQRYLARRAAGLSQSVARSLDLVRGGCGSAATRRSAEQPVRACIRGDFRSPGTDHNHLAQHPDDDLDDQSCRDDRQRLSDRYRTAKAGDVWVIEVFGALGGLLSIVLTIRRMRPTQAPYTLLPVQSARSRSVSARSLAWSSVMVISPVSSAPSPRSHGPAIFILRVLVRSRAGLRRPASRIQKGSELIGGTQSKNDPNPGNANQTENAGTTSTTQ